MRFKAIVTFLVSLFLFGCGGSETSDPGTDTPVVGAPADPVVADIVVVTDDQNERSYTFRALATDEQINVWRFEWQIRNSAGGVLASFDQADIQYEFQQQGNFVVELTVLDAESNFQTDTFELTIAPLSQENNPPAAKIETVSNGLSWTFDGRTSTDADNDALSYVWNIDSLATLTGDLVEYTFEQVGTYQITLTVSDGQSQNTASVSIVVQQNTLPVPSFTVEQEGLIVIVDASTTVAGAATIASYSWDFDGEVTKTGVRTHHFFQSAGVKNITLLVVDSLGGEQSLTKQVSLSPAEPSNTTPVAQFDYVTTDLTVTFTNMSSDADNDTLSFDWNFGDGNTSNLANPSHLYTAAGSYDVTLTVSDGQVSKSVTQSVSVVAPNRVPFAQFSHSQDALRVSFTNSSTDADGDELNYTWQFGDGNVSDQRNPTHEYSTPGTYVVELSVSDGTATSTTSESLTVSTANQAPQASFVYSADFLTVVFDASSSSDPDEGGELTYLWDFGDGTSSTLPQPTHIYAEADMYDVTLTVSDGVLSDSETQTVVVSAEPVDASPVARFVISDQSELSVTVDASTSSDNEDALDDLMFSWDFNGEATGSGRIVTHEFVTAGEKTITLTVRDSAQNEDMSSAQVTVTSAPPVDLLSYVVTNVISGDINCIQCHTAGGIAGATNLIFSELTNESVQSTLTTFIERDNPSNVQLLKDKPSNVVVHAGGNKFEGFDEEKQQWEALVDQIAATIAVPSDPEANFTYAVTDFVVGVDASTTVEASDAVHNYAWSVDNGLTANGETAELDLGSAGEYVITLTVTDTSTNRTDSTFSVITIDNQNTGASCDDTALSHCFDFESGLPSELEGQDNAVRTIDTSTGYNSGSSAKLTTTAFSDAKFFSIPVPAPDFWARVFIKSSGDMGEYASDWGGDAQGFARPHGTLIRGLDGAAQMRIGDHRCQLEINRDQGPGHLGDDLEMTSGSYGDNDTVCAEEFGARMEPDTWYCLEVHFNGPESEIQVFWDNQNVQQLHVTEERTWTNADKAPGGPYSQNSDQPWGPYDFDTFEFGYENYEGSGPTQPNGQKPKPTITYWYDDVATHTERIGCGDDYAENATLHPSTQLGVGDNGYPYDGAATEPSPTPSPTPDPGNVGDGTLIFSEDFENYETDSYPGDWGYFVNYQADLSYDPSIYESVIKVTDSEVYRGNKALHLINESPQAPVQITRVLDTTKFTDRVFLRMYIKQSVDLGRSPGNNHATLVGLRGVTGQSEKEVRFGDAKGVLGINIIPTDGISPIYEKQASQLSAAELAAAPMITKDEWHCLELAFLDDGPESQVYAWNNDELIFSVESREDFAPGGPTEPHWLTEQMHEVMIGWQSWIFGGDDAINRDIWVDDIVASTERIGCN